MLNAIEQKIVIGVGNRLKFWQDRWCGDQPFQVTFPVLYAITTNREASVGSSLAQQGLEVRRGWDVRFIWDTNDQEVDLMADFIHILESNTLSLESEDRMKQKLKRNGDFDIYSFYNKLSPSLERCLESKGPQRISFFVWTIAWDKILTGDNLRHRGFDFVDYCVMCMVLKTGLGQKLVLPPIPRFGQFSPVLGIFTGLDWCLVPG